MSVQLEYVRLQDKTIHYVGEFALLHNKQRPPCYCPLCEQAVTLKLGHYRNYHAAHKPSSLCVLQGGESIGHFNKKMELFLKFQQMQMDGQFKPFKVNMRCHCGHTDSVEWLECWDEVRVEPLTNKFRPDIGIYWRGELVGAIEVVFSHKMDWQKRVYFREEEIRWIEISEFFEWSLETPIDYSFCGHIRTPQECWLCQAEHIGHKGTVQVTEHFRSKPYIEVVSIPPDFVPLSKRPVLCGLCGRKTTDWWQYNPSTETCKCVKCLQEKRYAPTTENPPIPTQEADPQPAIGPAQV